MFLCCVDIFFACLLIFHFFSFCLSEVLTFFVQFLQYLKLSGRFQNSTPIDIYLFLKANSSFYYIFPLCSHIIFVLFQ